jgi:hypothetical protein
VSVDLVRELNDALRRTFLGGEVMMTAGIAALADDMRGKVLEQVKTFDAFTPDNDPYREHDFGAFEVKGHRIFWKIDYYDAATEAGSEDPADPSQTTRVLTIMLASEY